MTTTITIPLATYAVGSQTVGPRAIPAGYTMAFITIDRTVGNFSLNSRPATTTLDFTVEESDDGGVTWPISWIGHAFGGTYIDNETGLTEDAASIQCPLLNPDSTTRQARSTITVGGSKISFAGTLTLS